MISITFEALSVLANVWINNPTIMFIENTESPIREIPFPSIMICPSSQIRKSVWDKFMDTNSSYCCSEVFQSDGKWQNTTLDNVCQYIQPIIGIFGISFSNPAEYYSVTPRKFVTPDTYTKIQITPFVKKINSDLMWRSLEIRQCYLHNERQLSIFQQYTELNCNYECEINKTISMCGCMMIEGAYSTKFPENQMVCNCLPTCSMIEYEVTDTSHFDDWNYLKLTNLVKNKCVIVNK
ncbi:pickpocket protein 11-like [Acyrthosiphon pisum]|uniref:Uncharacterized protein n=1 Tax=Acyrthosiphon pisum TaxID=7029 RepID=A0A8R2D310_ACYPI|nr:pickpocket protein 11-like [Acyrthosiphon pisum]|eukprot:XP_016657249.1 PREDICTED: pickpocket protein 11-like [Acyrthosiphon pisum]